MFVFRVYIQTKNKSWFHNLRVEFQINKLSKFIVNSKSYIITGFIG